MHLGLVRLKLVVNIDFNVTIMKFGCFRMGGKEALQIGKSEEVSEGEKKQNECITSSTIFDLLVVVFAFWVIDVYHVNK